MAAVVVALVKFVRTPSTPSNKWQARVRLARDIAEKTPPDVRVGAFWPDGLAQFSGRPVIPLDGIAGSPDYFRDYVRSGSELEYLVRGQAYLSIRLPNDVDNHLRSTRTPASWTKVGQIRLRELEDVKKETVSARTFGPSGEGWYLVRLSPEDR